MSYTISEQFSSASLGMFITLRFFPPVIFKGYKIFLWFSMFLHKLSRFLLSLNWQAELLIVGFSTLGRPTFFDENFWSLSLPLDSWSLVAHLQWRPTFSPGIFQHLVLRFLHCQFPPSTHLLGLIFVSEGLKLAHSSVNLHMH